VLYVRDGTTIESLLHGAGHESGRRAGTESVLLAAGLGEACRIAMDWIEMPSVKRLRDVFWFDLRKEIASSSMVSRITVPPVLEAMGIAPEIGMGAIRFSLGRGTTFGEIDEVLGVSER
jgi:cysteine desulfurase